MRYETAPFRLLIWLAAAALGWAVLAGVVLYLPQALAGLAVAGVLLWRKGARPVDLSPAGPVAAGRVPAEAAPRVRTREDVRTLVATSA